MPESEMPDVKNAIHELAKHMFGYHEYGVTLADLEQHSLTDLEWVHSHYLHGGK